MTYDNEGKAPIVRRTWPLVRKVDGRYLWAAPGGREYQAEPELERILMAALERRKQADVD